MHYFFQKFRHDQQELIWFMICLCWSTFVAKRPNLYFKANRSARFFAEISILAMGLDLAHYFMVVGIVRTRCWPTINYAEFYYSSPCRALNLGPQLSTFYLRRRPLIIAPPDVMNDPFDNNTNVVTINMIFRDGPAIYTSLMSRVPLPRRADSSITPFFRADRAISVGGKTELFE